MQYGKLCKYRGADVVKPEEDWTSDRNKFTYEGSWGESADEFGGGKYTTSAGTSVTFTFEGEQAAIYGTKGSEAGKVLVSVDGGEAKEVDLSGNGKDGDALIYYTGKLENAKHTVMISKAEGHEEKLLEINHAKVIHGEFIEQAEGVESSGTVFTVSGVRPILPDKVKVVSNQGNITEKAVVWDVEGQDFTSDVKLTGSVEGTDKKGTVDVKIVPEHMAYYIDCNSPKSPAYASVDAYADLLNEVPDQAYEKDAWGYVETYGAHDTDESNLKDAYETGWWAKEGQSIQYTIPLEKGSYKVEFGFKEWWKDYNSSRPMKVSMVQGETKTELGTTNTWNGGNWWNDAEYEITCETAGDVTFEIAKNGDLDPVLSFIKIQKVLDTEALKGVLAQAAQIDRSQYSAKKLKVLDQTVEEGHPLLYKAEATQKLIEEATDKIQTALDALEADTGIELTQQEIEANDYVLYTVNCGTPDVSVLPNPESERMGLLQSSFDQPYGEDKEKETTWGLNPENEFSKAEKYQANATDIGDSFIYMSENVTFDKDKSTLGYSFEVPDTMEGMEEDTYEVTVAFKLPNWDKRVVNVMLEGSTVATDISLEQNSWVSRTFTTKVTDGELNVLVKAPRRTSTKQDPILNYIKVRAVKDTEPVIPNYTSFTGIAGETMYDTNGNQIQAHGGQIQKLTVDGVTKWYWIGEDKTNDYRPCGGIHMYSSEDLYNWKDEGVVLKTMESMEQFESDPYFKELYGNETQEQKEEVFVDLDKNNCVMERPKMLYNEKTDKYVIWFHADGRYPGSDADYGKAKAGVAIGDSPTGPFKLLGSYKLDYDKSENPNYGYDGWEGREEIQELSKAYNTMLERINQYIEERMKIQEEKRNAEIHALQMQINPHYMYNTLASIKWLTWQGDVKKSTAVIDAFISLLRNTISNTDEFVTVEQEVANLKNYVLINQTRYGDAVGVEFYVVDKCKEYLVPKLILQPFVENAFFHAFPEGMEGEISVFIKEEKKYLRFDIEDNGVGMDAEQLYTLNNKKDKKSEHFTGIGINNVDDRIKLIYGMDYGINIVSEKDKGTTITILLPRKEKEHGNSI